MLTAILLNFGSPLKPAHILWINLITDSLPALALGVDPGDPEHFMHRPPVPEMRIFLPGAAWPVPCSTAF